MARSRNRGRLNVWLNGVPVGQWNNAGSTPTFQYFDEWLAHEQGRPLSLSMPFRPDNGAYSGDLVTNYFDNLLPDSDQNLVNQFMRFGEQWAISLLVGAAAIGLLRFVAAGFKSRAAC